MDFVTIVLTVLLIVFVCYYFSTKTNRYDNTGIPYIKPLPILGNMGPPMLRLTPFAEHIQKHYNFNKKARYIGFFDFSCPTIVIRDPDLIKDITIKHFDNFVDHRGFVDPVQDPLFAGNLFSISGDYWREMRTILSPAFTSSKLKGMYELMFSCAENFVNYFVETSKEKSSAVAIDAKDVFAKYTNDVIASVAFGITVDSIRNPNNDFYVLGDKYCNFRGNMAIKFFLLRSFPRLSRLFGIKVIPAHVENFFYDVIREAVATRDEKGISRPDMLQLMMETRNKSTRQLTIEEMTAQAFIFFFGGFDTSSTLMSFVAYVIASNPSIKKKLQDEVDKVYQESNGEPTYDMIKSMEYLDAVINETLRYYPVGLILDRMCTKEFELPPTLPGAKPYRVKVGETVWFPVYALHQDPNYFPDADKFLPERFLNKSNLVANSPAYLPFGAGPRMCIGNRFALMEVKVLVYHLMSKCDLKISRKMKLPLKIKKSIELAFEGDIWIDVEPRLRK